MLITAGVLALDFALCAACATLRLDRGGNRHLGIKCSQMRFDESQLHQITQGEKGNTPLYGSRQQYCTYTHACTLIVMTRSNARMRSHFRVMILR